MSNVGHRFPPEAVSDHDNPTKPRGDDIVRVVKGCCTGFVGKVMGLSPGELRLFGTWPGIMIAQV